MLNAFSVSAANGIYKSVDITKVFLYRFTTFKAALFSDSRLHTTVCVHASDEYIKELT